jgi:hypothetical protein
VARLEREPSFLPLTLATAYTVAEAVRSTPVLRAGAEAITRKTIETNAAAAECWTALLADCDAPGTRALPRKLGELTEVTSMFAGPQWWNGAGSQHRQRVSRARQRIEEAVAERDGADFAEAFAGYDQAVATALARAHSRLESSTR